MFDGVRVQRRESDGLRMRAAISEVSGGPCLRQARPWLREVDADCARTDNGAIRHSSRRDTMTVNTDHAELARADWSTLIPHK
jgi:hypothetical protein